MDGPDFAANYPVDSDGLEAPPSGSSIQRCHARMSFSTE